MSVFAEAIAALETLGGLIRDAAQLPKRRRRQYLDAVTEAFTLLQAAVVLVETRLGDLLHIQDDEELTDEQKRRRFVQELANLDNTEQWLRLEREVALCRSLRVINVRLDSALQRLGDRLALKDQQTVDELISNVLEREAMLAVHISSSLQKLADLAPNARTSAKGRASAWRAVSRQRRAISAERHSLIEAERRFLESL